MKTINRWFVLTLTVIMLLSVMCPVAALAEMGVTDDSDSAQTAETTDDTDITVEEPSSGNEEIAVQENSSGENLEEQIEEEIISEPVVEQQTGSSAAQENNTEPAAGTTEVAAGSTVDSLTQQKQENTTAGIQAAGGATGKAAEASISTGSLSAADGSVKSTRTKTNAELFISAKGSDESGNGSFEAPFASIPAALNAARGMGVDAELCLLSNLSISGTVHILGMNVYLASNEGAYTITRNDAFSLGEGGQDTAMFAIGSPEQGNSSGGQLILEHVALNEKGAKTEPVQDGIIAVYSGGKLILGEEAMLLNYGGNSAVYAGSGSEVTVSATGWILDDMVFEEDGTVAIQEEEGSTVIREEGCIVLSHGETYENVYGQIDGENDNDITDNNAGNSGNLLSSTGNPEAGVSGENGKTDNAIADSKGDNKDDGEDPTFDDGGNDADKNGKTDGKVADETSENTSDEAKKPDANTDKGIPALTANRILTAQGNALNNVSLQAEAPAVTAPSFAFEAPESISSSDRIKTIHSYTAADVAGYEIPYTLSLNLGSFGTTASAAADTLTKADIQLTITLDSLPQMYPETESAGSLTAAITPDFNVLGVKSALYDNSNRTITVVLSTDDISSWKSHLDELKQELTLTLSTVVLPNTETEAYPYNITSVTSSAKVDNISFVYGERTDSLSPSALNDSAATKLLGAKTVNLVYNPNTGTGGPGTQQCAPETSHTLDQTPAPTHAAANGKPVLFCGWTMESDKKIYADGDNAPNTVTTVDLKPSDQEVVVYAVYSYDRNNDSIPDVQQRLLTLGYDANGGAGAPGPEIKAAVGGIEATFDISKTEPTRKGYTFLGWSKDENATEGEYKYNAERRTKRDITIARDTCLYAVWEENPVYTLYFNGNGGTNIPNPVSARSEMVNGSYVAEMSIPTRKPTRTGRTFVGWSTQRYGTAAFEPGEAVRLTGGDVTLFAVWERNGSSSGRAPKTGDESNVPLYAALAAGSAAAAYAVVRVLKKRRK